MNTRELSALALALGAGLVTEKMIRDAYGDSILTAVLGFGVGSVAGGVAAKAAGGILDVVEETTGLVSVADDVLGAINPFNW